MNADIFRKIFECICYGEQKRWAFFLLLCLQREALKCTHIANIRAFPQ